MVYEDKWGFQVNQWGEILDTPYNVELELAYQEQEAEDNRRSLPYSRGMNNGHQHIDQNVSSRINRNNTITNPDRQNRHPALNKSYQEQTVMPSRNVNQSYNATRTSLARKAFDLDVDDIIVESKQPAVQQQAVESLNIPVKRKIQITKPADFNYHDILLPAGYRQIKTSLPPDDRDEEITFNYYKREIIKEAIEGDDMDNRFGEGYFNDNKNFIPVSIEKAEIISLNKKENDTAVVLENGEDLIDQILYMIPEDRMDASKIYINDVFIAAKYYNNTGKNLFMELATMPVSSPVELMMRLEEIHKRYANNEYTRNGLAKIDNALKVSLNTYLAAFCGRPGYFVNGFMLGVRGMYEKIKKDVKDSDLRRNLLSAITTFLTNLLINIKQYASMIPDEDTTKELYCPTRELLVVSKNKNIIRELSEISKEQPNEYLFKLIDRKYTPYIHDMVERLDKDKMIQSYNRLVFFTFENMYSIIKGETGGYYISSFNRLTK